MKALKNNRMFILSLAALLLASCSDHANNDNQTTAITQTTANAAAETESLDMLDARQKLSDNLPEKDWGGKPFHIVVQEYTEEDFIPEEEAETGALINDAVFRRNNKVEERFNIDLIIEAMDSSEANAQIQKSVNASDDAYQLYCNSIVTITPLSIENYYLDLNAQTYIDLSQPWWNQSCRDALSIDNKIFVMAGSIAPSFLTHTYCVYMNKRLGSDIDLTSEIYDIVFDGKWTIDKYIELVKDSWKDLNGNGKQDEMDQYGLAAQVTSYTTPFIYSFGETTVSRDEDGMPVLDMDLEKFADMVDKVYTLLYESNGTITTDGWGLHAETFAAGRALFMNGVFLQAYSSFNEMEDDFAILPFPKWNAEQAEYLTMSDGASPMIAIPTTVSDPEMCSIITEALAAEAYKTIIPAVYDNAIKVRGTRDENSMKLIDIIERGNVVDFGYVFGDYNTMGFTMSDMMGKKNKNFASYYEKREEKWKNKIQKIIDSYLESSN